MQSKNKADLEQIDYLFMFDDFIDNHAQCLTSKEKSQIEAQYQPIRLQNWDDQDLFQNVLQAYKTVPKFTGTLNPYSQCNFRECCYYSGQLKNGQPNGKGILYFHKNQGLKKEMTASFYEGEFKEGKRDGFGKYISHSFSISGFWKNDCVDGKCEIETKEYIFSGFFDNNNFISNENFIIEFK